MTVPHYWVDSVADTPDAAKLNSINHYLEAISNGDFLTEGSFESWNPTSFTNPSNGDTIITGAWTWVKTGTSVPTVNVAREATTILKGSYSCKIDMIALGSSDSLVYLRQAVAVYSALRGTTMYAGVVVKTLTANKVRFVMYDGVNTSYSAWHTGDGTWQKLSTQLNIDAAAGGITIMVQVTGDFQSDQVYVDGGFAYVIDPLANADAKNALESTPAGEARAQILTAVLANAQSIPSGTKMVFYQASVPTGWTAVGSINDKFLRSVTNGTSGGTTGGTHAASTSLAHDHTIASEADHDHASTSIFGTATSTAVLRSGSPFGTSSFTGARSSWAVTSLGSGSSATDKVSSSGAHSHGGSTTGSGGFSGSFAYADVCVGSKN